MMENPALEKENIIKIINNNEYFWVGETKKKKQQIPQLKA